MPISAVMINEFSLGQMIGQASMQSGAICFTAFNMAGLSHGPTSDSTAATTTKRQATLLSMARVWKKRLRWCLKVYTANGRDCQSGVVWQLCMQHEFLDTKSETTSYIILQGRKRRNETTKPKKNKKGREINKRRSSHLRTFPKSAEKQGHSVIQHLTAAHMQKKSSVGLLWRQAIQCKKHLNWRGKTTLPDPILIWGSGIPVEAYNL